MAIQIIDENRNPTFLEQLGGGVEGFMEAYGQAQDRRKQENQQRSMAKLLGLDEEEFGGLPMEAQLKGAELQKKQEESYLKRLQEQRESEALQKIRKGEELSQEEEMALSPTSQRSLIREEKPLFEEESEKLAAKRSAKTYEETMDLYQGARNEDMRLDRMEKLSEKGDLSTPLMVKSMNTIGLPLSVLSNPDTEEFQKLEADFLRDVRNVFPGGRITNFEISSYMKTVPGLANSQEGRKRIIQNRRLFNEAKKLKGEALKQVVKENKGRTPRNLDILIEERVGPQLDEISERFREGIESATSELSPMYPVRAPDGSIRNIPANKLKQALNAGGELL